MAKVLEPIYGKMSPDGETIVAPLRPIAMQKAIDALMHNPPRVFVRLRSWEELDELDIIMDHPMMVGAVGPYKDTNQPMIPSGGRHVMFSDMIGKLRADGRVTLVMEYEYSKTGRRSIATDKRTKKPRVIDVIDGETLDLSVPHAAWLLSTHGILFEEVDPDEDTNAEPDTVEETAPPKPKKKPAYTRKKKAAPKAVDKE